MRQFFFNLLESLDKVAGIRQLDKIYAAHETKEAARIEINLLIDELCNACNRFDYIPRTDMQRIIQDGILSDPEFFGLHGRIIFKWLSKNCGAYYKEKIEPIELPEGVEKYEVVTGEKKQEYLDQWMKSLKSFDDSVKVGTKPGTQMKKMLDELPKMDDYRMPTAEQLMLHDLHIEWLRANFHPVTREKLPGYLSEDEWLRKQGI